MNQKDTTIECGSDYFKYTVVPINLVIVLLIGVVFPVRIIMSTV